ncbi:MAG: 50S ribosomal protein L24 [Elusimicrobia bacterium GWB2_63_22]|nr:MAG: 50S ribosomal protein L24 [Elusimicrobia bacterium GWB2_63_22]
MLKLKKKDTIIVLAGKDKGKKGEVKEIIPSDRKVVVMGINIVSKHKKTTKAKPGGIHKVEAPMDISNVQLVCPKCGKPARVKVTVQGGEKMRACKKCGEVIV